MNRQSSNFQRNRAGQSNVLSIKRLFLIILRNWYWFAISILIAGAGAFLYTRYTFSTYQVNSTILIEEEDNSGTTGLDSELLEGFGLSPGSQNLDNQILLLSSWTVIGKALDDLPFSSDCYKKGPFNTVSFFPMEPIRLVEGPNGVPRNIEFCIQYDQNEGVRLTTTNDDYMDLDTIVSLGQEIVLKNGSFTIFPVGELKDISSSKQLIYFIFHSKEALIESFQRRLTIEPASPEATILRLSLEGTNKAKDIVFLDKLIEVHMMNNLDKKNTEAKRIIDFIDAQLVDVSDSLMQTESQLQEFRSKNRIMDVSAQSQQIIDQAVQLENEKARLTLVSNYYEYLEEYLAEEVSQEVPISPATMGIEDPNLGRLMQDFAGLQAEYFSSGVGERNPLQGQLEIRMSNTKKGLQETLHGIKLANQMAMDENKAQIDVLNERAARLPVKERQLLGFERKFNLNNVLYNFLLQQRAEAQIQKASNTPDNELIEPARAVFGPVAPIKIIIYLFAIFLGIGVPFLITFAWDGINDKISSEDDLKQITDLPVVGHIPHTRLSYGTIVLSETQSRVSEAFRNFRMRMEFFTNQEKSPIIMISSAMPGDGKSFTSINLASVYSLTGKKTVLVGFDLRKPTLLKSFDINKDIGLTSYLIGKSPLEDIIMDTGYPNLYVIPSGPIPPNPGEISSSEQVKELFEILKDKFDYIIVDSAPIGVVSDNYIVASIADATVLMVRHEKTQRRYLKATLAEAAANGVKGMSILMNDLPRNKSSYRYSYNAKYEYKN